MKISKNLKNYNWATKKLVNRGCLNYCNDNTTVYLTTPDNTSFEVLIGTRGSILFIFRGVSGEEFTIEDKDIIEAFEKDGEIHIETVNGECVLRAEFEDEYGYKVFNFCCYDSEIIGPHEIVTCIKRAKKLEAFINSDLQFDEYYPVKVHVQFDVKIEINEDYFLKYEGAGPIYHHCFNIWLGDTEGGVVYADCGSPDIDITNVEALKYLRYVFARNLLPVDAYPKMLTVLEKFDKRIAGKAV